MQLIHELNQISCIFRRALLSSGFPSTVIILSKSRKFLPVGVQSKCFKCCCILLTIVTTNVDPVISSVRIRLLSVPIRKHIIDQFIHANRFTEPYPPVHLRVCFLHHLSGCNQIRTKPVHRHIPVIRVNVDAVLTLLHFLAPQIDRSIWVLWRVVQIDHLESTLISPDERCFNVGQLIFALTIIEELCQLI